MTTPYREAPKWEVKILIEVWRKDGVLVKDWHKRLTKRLEDALNEGWTIAGQSEGSDPSVTYTLTRFR